MQIYRKVTTSGSGTCSQQDWRHLQRESLDPPLLCLVYILIPKIILHEARVQSVKLSEKNLQ